MKKNIYPNLIQSVLYVLALTVLSFGYFTLLYGFGNKIPKLLFLTLNFSGRLIYFLPLIYMLWRRSNVNLNKQIFAPNMTEVVITIFSTGLLFCVYYFFTHHESNKHFVLSVTFLETIILAPIFEEIFFRGLILHQLLKKYKFHWAILFSSLLFAFSHLDLNIMIPTFIYSLIVSLIYLKFRQSLILVILSHFIWNLLILII